MSLASEEHEATRTTSSCEWDPQINCAMPAASCSITQVVPGMIWRNLPSIAAQGADSGVLNQVVALAEKIWPGPASAPNNWMGQIQ